jgi:hypothetical protein
MPQPVSYNPGTPVSGSIQENNISYVVDGQQRNYRGGFGGLSWMSEVPAANNVIFIGNSTSLGRGPANIPLFYPAYNNSSANIVYAANTLPGSPRNFTTTGSAYNWAVTNNFFINNSDNPIPRIDADGLVLYVDANQPTSYPQTGTTWYDLSGKGTNGTLQNGVSWIAPSSSFFFDGTDDYVSLGNLGTIGDNQTIEIWFNSNSVTSYKNVLDMNYSTYNPNTGNVGPRLEQYNSGEMQWYWSGNTTNNNIYNASATTPLLANRWYHTIFTLNSGAWQWHLNGTLIQSGTSPQGYITTYGDVNVGRGFILDPSRYFSGFQSSVRIYNKTLSTSEVKQNYFQSNIVQDGLVFMVDANNLVSYPKSGTTLYNLTGSSGNALLYNGPTYVPQYGGGINRDNTDDFISASISNSSTTNYSVETWFKANPLTGANYNALISAWNYPIGAGGWEFQFYNGVLGVHPTYTVAYTPNTVAHAVYTQNGTETKIYLNGVLQQTSTTSGVTLNNGSIGIGNLSAPGYGGYNLEGTFYNVRLYNKTLSSDEVQQNYQATKDKFQGQQIITNGLTLYLDSANKDSYPGTGTTWTDLSGNGNNGTLVNGPSFLPNVNSGIFDFDGVDDYTSLGFSAASLIQGKTAVTIGIFFKLDVLASLRGLIGTLNYGCGANLGLVASGNALTFYNDTGTCYDVGISSFVETGKWIYAVGTYDGTTTRMYGIKDGSLSQSSGTGKSGATNTFTSDFRIIGNQYPDYFTNGQCGTAFVYNRVLSQAEILQNYNAIKGRFGL